MVKRPFAASRRGVVVFSTQQSALSEQFAEGSAVCDLGGLFSWRHLCRFLMYRQETRNAEHEGWIA